MKLLASVLTISVLFGCAAGRHQPATVPAVTPSGEMPEAMRVRSLFSDPSDRLMMNYNNFAEKMNRWVWDYARGLNNTKASREAEKAFDKLSDTDGWSPRPRFDLEEPCEVQ